MSQRVFKSRVRTPGSRPVALPVAWLLLLLASAPAMAIEQPRFAVEDRDGAFELRRYAPYLVAETRVVGARFEEAGNVAFRRLFRYISGQNEAQQKIAMTAPVTQAPSEKIAMTAPVAQVADADGYRVAFVVPAKYTRETVPRPLDPSIEIREVPGQLVAAWRYTGRWTAANYRENEAFLRARMQARSLVAAGPPVLARYDPPFMPAFLRRNEILIPVQARAVE